MNILSLLQSGDKISALIAILYRVPAVLIALTLHELAHGYIALKCGDPTAKMLGRLSFNPLKHLDPVGTLFMLLFGFGWARPVPVNPRNYGKFRRDDLLVSIAGVVLNFMLFFFTTLIMVGINQLLWKPELWQYSLPLTFERYDTAVHLSQQGAPLFQQKDFLSFSGLNFYSVFSGENKLLFAEESGMIAYFPGLFEEYLRTPWLLYVQRFFMNFASINLGLCLFNLLPIPPLDGYHVVNDIFLRGRLHISARVMNIIMYALLAVMFFTDFISNLLGNAIYFVQNGVLSSILAIFGLG